jgi:hypothetical protein
MATFIVRVQLDRGTIAEYTTLKNLLIKIGFTKVIKDKTGVGYLLPNGNYLGESDKDIMEIVDIVKKIAAKVKRGSMVLVTEAKPKGNAWHNLPPT